MALNLIAAIGENYELGKNNELIWHFKEDMKFFKETTMGSSVIMGRKTFESLPKALPKRQNIVVTRKADYIAEGAEVVHSVQKALDSCENDDVFVIGGGRLYGEMLLLCDRLYLTEIEATCESADTYFPSFNKAEYDREIINEFNVDGIKFSHVIYTKR